MDIESIRNKQLDTESFLTEVVKNGLEYEMNDDEKIELIEFAIGDDIEDIYYNWCENNSYFENIFHNIIDIDFYISNGYEVLSECTDYLQKYSYFRIDSMRRYEFYNQNKMESILKDEVLSETDIFDVAIDEFKGFLD